MRKENLKSMAGICLFYLLLIIGVIIVNARFEYLNDNINTNYSISLES